MIRKLTILIIISAVLIKQGAASIIEKDQSVKINILSKQLRLLQEGKLKSIQFDIPQNIKTEDYLNNSFIDINSIKLFFKDKMIFAEYNNQIHENMHLKITSEDKNKYIRIKIKNNWRQYPANLEIKIKKKLYPVIYIKEDVFRYAADSALAEYGIRNENEREAVKALTHLILARSFQRKKNLHNKEYDFSDLTYDQVYRGIMPGRKNFIIKRSDWVIDAKNLKDELFFHAACGGETFDSSVFNTIKPGYSGVKDILYREGIVLCKKYHAGWEREISTKELEGILEGNSADSPLKFQKRNLAERKSVKIFAGSPLNPPEGDFRKIKIFMDKKNRNVLVQYPDYKKVYSMETFRLKINRVKGWSFIKSNNYTLSSSKKGKSIYYHFKGSGLGHGVGLCQQGALELARRGYNYYEIIKHYYPEIKFIENSHFENITPNLSYLIFNLYRGKVVSTNNNALIKRKFPPGSFWKIIVSLYLAKERPDLFNEYQYECKGTSNKNNPLPERCWTIKGHGRLNLEKALANSCNLYFASLYNKLNRGRFYRFYKKLCQRLKINSPLAPAFTDKAWSRQLAGLDFSITFKTNDLVKIIRLLNLADCEDKNINGYKNEFPVQYRNLIYAALSKIFISGTASGKVKEYGNSKNYLPLLNNPKIIKILKINKDNLWGKTSTVIDGTNKPINYGMFFGARGERGIIVFLRRGNGHLAAKWAKYLFFRKKSGL